MANQQQKTHSIAVAAMLAAVAATAQFLEISVPVMPGFVKLDLSDLPALLGTFALGPVWGVVIELVKNLLHLPFGHSAGVGELCNFVLGGVFVFVAGAVYHRSKGRGAALAGSLLGTAAMAAVSLPLNYFFVYPAYVAILHFPLDAIIGAYEAIASGVSGALTGDPLLNCLLLFNAPFTLCKGLLNVLVCFVVYKPLSPLLHK